MFIHESTGELNAKLVYLGSNPDPCVQHLERIHAALAPGLASTLSRIRGDGQHLSHESELVFFDFAPVTRAQQGGMKLRLHLYALASTPSPADLEFLLRGVDVLLLVRTADTEADARLVQTALGIIGAPPPIGLELCDESVAEPGASSSISQGWPVLRTGLTSGEGVIEALQQATRALIQHARSAT